MATSGSAAAVAVPDAAVDRIATLRGTEIAETAEVEVAATFGSKGSHRRMVSDDVADQGAFPSLANLDASGPGASTFAWLIPVTPLGFADLGSLSMIEASFASFGVTWSPAVGDEVDHRPPRPEVTADVGVRWYSCQAQAELLEELAVHGDGPSSSRDTVTYAVV